MSSVRYNYHPKSFIYPGYLYRIDIFVTCILKTFLFLLHVFNNYVATFTSILKLNTPSKFLTPSRDTRRMSRRKTTERRMNNSCLFSYTELPSGSDLNIMVGFDCLLAVICFSELITSQINNRWINGLNCFVHQAQAYL